jgi:catechol 2,3-dioxygenase-like lactoylglutathione lyase family enzyme
MIEAEPRAELTPAPTPMVLTHGTLEIDDVQASMAFYRDFLGMEVTQHVPFGCRISLGGPWYIVCLEVKHPHSMPVSNHFGFDCASKDEVDAWHARVEAEAARHGLSDLTRARSQHGAYSFKFRDRDRNWWEIQYYEGDAEETHLAWGRKMLGKAAAGKQARAARAARPEPAP